MWKFFQRWGRVLNVFMPRRLDARIKRFGFVRFQCVKDVEVLERRLDSVWIGLWKAQVNKPRYERREVHMKERVSWKCSSALRKFLYQKVQFQGVDTKATKSGSVSYAQAVKNGGTSVSQEDMGKEDVGQESRVPSFFVKSEVPKWLEHSYVGRLSKASDIRVVQESFIMGGLNFVRVLLSSYTEGSIENILEEHKEWLDDIFDSIVPWVESFEVTKKLVWIRCRGIPLKFLEYPLL